MGKDTSEDESLFKLWEKKLKSEGLVGGTTSLVMSRQRRIDPKLMEYNKLCWDLLNSGKITDKYESFILEKHCEGVSSRETVSLIKKLNIISSFKKVNNNIGKTSVVRDLTRVLHRYGIKYRGFKK